MKQINLLKKHGGTGRGVPFFYADNYLSNGRFLVHESLVKNKDDYIHLPPARYEAGFLRIIPAMESCKQFDKTPFIHNEARVFKSQDGEFMLIYEEWVKLFSLEFLHAIDNRNPARTLKGDVVVMPMKPDDFEKALILLNKAGA